MRFIGNLIWLILGGLVGAVCWFLVGCLWCVTVLGIPIGLQCFKFAKLCLFPFWKDKAIVEIELADENCAVSFPPELKVIREVTEDEAYTNAALAQI